MHGSGNTGLRRFTQCLGLASIANLYWALGNVVGLLKCRLWTRPTVERDYILMSYGV
jgi:hypothetical protein